MTKRVADMAPEERELKRDYDRKRYMANRKSILRRHKERYAMMSNSTEWVSNKRATQRAWYWNNRKRVLEQKRIAGRKRYAANREKFCAKVRMYRSLNKIEINASVRARRREDPLKFRQQSSIRNAKKRKARILAQVFQPL